ncbi:MAG: formimidoylglutamase [Bacteroidota bacterium]
MNNYIAPNVAEWTGRATCPDLPPQYWYQRIGLLDARLPEGQWPAATHALLGYACDEGVRRNHGRVGAVEGPSVARSYLSKMAAHFPQATKVVDAGDISCTDGNMEACQSTYAETVARLLKQNIFPIGIGGGHDIAFGTFSGLLSGLAPQSVQQIGILNFDAHFDLRPFILGPNSGTPFNQILTDYRERVEYFVVGIQAAANMPSLFDIAHLFDVKYISSTACGNDPASRAAVITQLQAFLDRIDYLYISVDLDGFSSAYAPGVSAASPVGFAPEFFFPVFQEVMKSGKVVALDIAEFCPAHDVSGQTKVLLGRVVEAVVA